MLMPSSVGDESTEWIALTTDAMPSVAKVERSSVARRCRQYTAVQPPSSVSGTELSLNDFSPKKLEQMVLTLSLAPEQEIPAQAWRSTRFGCKPAALTNGAKRPHRLCRRLAPRAPPSPGLARQPNNEAVRRASKIRANKSWSADGTIDASSSGGGPGSSQATA
jgi:hypothetical protein